MREAKPGPAFSLSGAGYHYPKAEQPALQDVELELDRRTFSAIIGPNGAGKSTLVRLLGGVVRPTRGKVAVLGRESGDWDRTALATRLAIVSQDAPPDALAINVRAYVELGRNPYVSPWAALGSHDHDMVDRALAWADLRGLELRTLAELSGGERQRAKLARALAQEPEILVLDEPSAHLDFRHALWVFDALRALVRDDGVTVVCITHDMHLASRHAERLVLLSAGRVVATGQPQAVLTSPELARAYGCEIRVEAHGELGHYVLPVRARPLPENVAR